MCQLAQCWREKYCATLWRATENSLFRHIGGPPLTGIAKVCIQKFCGKTRIEFRESASQKAGGVRTNVLRTWQTVIIHQTLSLSLNSLRFPGRKSKASSVQSCTRVVDHGCIIIRVTAIASLWLPLSPLHEPFIISSVMNLKCCDSERKLRNVMARK